jgi:hypothetical protein
LEEGDVLFNQPKVKMALRRKKMKCHGGISPFQHLHGGELPLTFWYIF